jgi:hypothetical protein
LAASTCGLNKSEHVVSNVDVVDSVS